MKGFENLDAFRSRGGTHVKHTVIRFNIEKCHRNHGDFLLAENVSRLRRIDNKAVELLQLRILAKLDSREFVKGVHSSGVRVPEHFFGDLLPQCLISLHLCDVIVECSLGLLSLLVDSVHAETDVQGLLELVVESVPL